MVGKSYRWDRHTDYHIQSQWKYSLDRREKRVRETETETERMTVTVTEAGRETEIELFSRKGI